MTRIDKKKYTLSRNLLQIFIIAYIIGFWDNTINLNGTVWDNVVQIYVEDYALKGKNIKKNKNWNDIAKSSSNSLILFSRNYLLISKNLMTVRFSRGASLEQVILAVTSLKTLRFSIPIRSIHLFKIIRPTPAKKNKKTILRIFSYLVWVDIEKVFLVVS